MKFAGSTRYFFLYFLLLTIVNSQLSTAQSGTSSAISGTVLDATSAALPDAAVTATNVDTKATRAGVTNSDGRYFFSQVNPGTYTVTVKASGFAERSPAPFPVEVGRTVTLNLTLRCLRQRRTS